MELTRWAASIVLWIIGLFFLIMTYGARIVSRKSGKFVSGVPLFGGLFLLAAGLLSPCKWLALLALLDFGFYELPMSMLGIPYCRMNKSQNPEKENQDETDESK